MNYGRRCRSRRSSETLVLKHARRPRAKPLELLSSSSPRLAATAVLSDRPISRCAQREAVMAAADRRTRALRIGDRPRYQPSDSRLGRICFHNRSTSGASLGAPDLSGKHRFLGRATTAAMPLERTNISRCFDLSATPRFLILFRPSPTATKAARFDAILRLGS
jgi:hypothetical protein